MRSAARRRRPATRRLTIMLGVLLVAGATLVGSGTAGPASFVAQGHAREAPCPDSSFECVTLGVPADHFAARSPTWDVTFALHRGTIDSRGVLVIASGGPGESGMAGADDQLATLPAALTDHYDVVLFDQRGVGVSEPFHCARTLSAERPAIDASATAAQRDAYAADASRFALDCFHEAGVDPATAGRYATRQVVADLESFRDWLGADRLIVYGESYGTQVAQTYAAAYPHRVAALVLDGVVDLTTDDLSFGVETAQAYSDVLTSTLTACDATPACAADAPGSAVQSYDQLAARLAGAPLSYRSPRPDGTTEERRLTLADLHSAATGAMSDPESREEFQQALNAATTGDVVPLARLEAQGVANDAGYDHALYYAVQCSDYDLVPPGSTGRAQLDVWLDRARAAGVDQARAGGLFYVDLPCLFWPGAGAMAGVTAGAGTQPERPAARADQPYPLLVLTADTDPNTPTQQARRVLARAPGDAALVEQQGGPHVVFGNGVACVDDPVVTLVTTGRLPAARTTTCPGPVATSYLVNPPATAAGYTEPSATLDRLIDASLDNVGYTWWNGAGQLTVGCDDGGAARYRDDGDAVVITLDDCAWTRGVPVRGTITVAGDSAGTAQGSLRLPFATLTFDRGTGTLTGTFRGAAIG